MSMTSTLPLDLTPAIHHDTTPEKLATARTELAAIVGSENINDDQETCAAHSGSRWAEASPSHKASLIVYPQNTEHVSAILSVCCRRSISVTPFSGGTGLSGSLAATRGGVCVDFRDMAGIWDLHESEMDITVQPGVGWMDLNSELAGKGLFFPPDPAPQAKIGGMVSVSSFTVQFSRSASLYICLIR
jgi:D-lactate dehydrogenase (cytochrome)